MATRFLSVEVDESFKNSCINLYEMYRQLYLSSINKIYTTRLEHSDIIALAEKDSYSQFSKISYGLQQFSCDIPLIYGPNQCLIESIDASICVGQGFQIELVLIDESNNETLGKLDLTEYVKIINLKTGDAVLNVENDKYLLCSSIMLVRQSTLCLRISGAIRINSTIKVIARLDGDL